MNLASNFRFTIEVILSYTDNCIRSSPSLTVTDSKNKIYTADLLIAADGTFSQVFKSLYPASDNRPVYRGYRVYRGYSEASKDIRQEEVRGNEGEGTTNTSSSSSSGSSSSSSSRYCQEVSSRYCEYGFQTWGPSYRFACVPTVSGNAWYVAVASKEAIGTSSGTGSSSASPPRRAYTGPFSNSSVTVGKEEFDSMKVVLNEWHNPIKLILDGTMRTPEPHTEELGTGVRVCDSYAFNCRETVRCSLHSKL